MSNRPAGLLLEFRSPLDASQHTPEQRRLRGVIVGMLIICLAGMAAGSLMMMGIGSWQDFQQALQQKASHSRSMSELLSKQGAAFDAMALLPLGVPVLLGLLVWAATAVQKRSTLLITDDAIACRYPLPWGLDRFLGLDWRIPFARIQHIAYGNPMLPAAVSLNTLCLRIDLGRGSVRYLRPGNWYRPGQMMLPPVQPVSQPGRFSSPRQIWAEPENQIRLYAAATRLPLIAELRTRGFAMQPPGPAEASRHDLFASRNVKRGIVGGLSLVIGAMVLMTARPTIHLQSLPSTSVILLCALLAGGLCAWAASREAAPVSPAHRVIASLILAAGSAFALPQATLLANGIGSGPYRAQLYEVGTGKLLPVDAPQLTPISLPGKQSRFGFLEKGRRLTLQIREGRFGLLEYDDSALRAEADRLGIR